MHEEDARVAMRERVTDRVRRAAIRGHRLFIPHVPKPWVVEQAAT